MKKTILISFPLMLILLFWISALLWIDFNPDTFGKVTGILIGVFIGGIVIVIIAFLEKKEVKLNKGVEADERTAIINQKSAYLNSSVYSILLVVAGISSLIITYAGYDIFKPVSYTFIFALALFAMTKGICFVLISRRY